MSLHCVQLTSSNNNVIVRIVQEAGKEQAPTRLGSLTNLTLFSGVALLVFPVIVIFIFKREHEDEKTRKAVLL